jgi:hypothetical protein
MNNKLQRMLLGENRLPFNRDIEPPRVGSVAAFGSSTPPMDNLSQENLHGRAGSPAMISTLWARRECSLTLVLPTP